MSEWYATLDGLLDGVWQRLSRGVADSRAPARYPVLATAGLSGGAEARTVALRAADRAAGLVEVHTDIASGKIAELRRDPGAALHVWDPRARLQIRLRVTVEIRIGDAEVWARVPEASRESYGVDPAPGTPIPASDAFARQPELDRFARLICRIDEIEAVVLSPDHHRRAIWARDSGGWRGGWHAP